MNTKKINPYLKMGIILLISAIGGGFLGFGIMYLFTRLDGSIETFLSLMTKQFQSLLLPLLLCITLLSILIGEMSIKKLKYICTQILQNEDEECDVWEYEEEKTGAFAMNMCTLSQVLCVIVLSVGYSIKYIESSDSTNFLIACILFIFCFAYDGFWQLRYVRLMQNTWPDKKADPTSTGFQKQWLASCDEAERQVIYQSTYKSYLTLNKCIPVLLVVTMLLHLFLDTGILAIIIVGIIWLTTTISYTRSCVKLKREKISG